MLARSATGPGQISTVALCAGSGTTAHCSTWLTTQADRSSRVRRQTSSGPARWVTTRSSPSPPPASTSFSVRCARGSRADRAGNHSNTERGYLPILQGRLKEPDEDGAGAEVIVSAADRDPLEFV